MIVRQLFAELLDHVPNSHHVRIEVTFDIAEHFEVVRPEGVWVRYFGNESWGYVLLIGGKCKYARPGWKESEAELVDRETRHASRQSSLLPYHFSIQTMTSNSKL